MDVAGRFLPASFLACGMTFALFWLMQALVVVEDRGLIPTPNLFVVPFVKVHEAPRPIETRRNKPELIHPKKNPPLPDVAPRTGNDAQQFGRLPVDPIDPSRGRDERFAAPGNFDRNAIAIVRIAPDYPARALRRGIEGRVLLEFTIGRTGAVENAKVIAAEPSSIFNAAALKAVRQWRYNPKIENGAPVEQHHIQISIPFRREDSASR